MMGSHATLIYLNENNLVAPNARVVLAGGEGARGIKGMIEKPRFESVEEFKDYIYLKSSPKHNPMNAIGVSKLCGALWTKKLASLENGKLDVVWFSPGLTSGSSGLNKLPPVKRWFMNTIVFGMMNLAGKSQSPEKGGRKFADCLLGKIGKNGDLIGAPPGKTLGPFADQMPLNALFPIKNLLMLFGK